MANEIDIAVLRERLDYDPETGKLTWKAWRPGKPAGWLRADGYLQVMVDKVYIGGHRICWAHYYGEWPTGQIDHINRNPLDNSIKNLRLATQSQNNANQTIRGQVNAKGVIKTKNGKKYMAHIKANGVCKYLGSFATIDEAAHAYNKAAVQLHGEYAVLNPIGVDK